MMNFKNYLRCVCFFALFFCFGGAFSHGADSVDVVFVGNSYTYANGMVESVRRSGVDPKKAPGAFS